MYLSIYLRSNWEKSDFLEILNDIIRLYIVDPSKYNRVIFWNILTDWQFYNICLSFMGMEKFEK